MPQQPDSRKGRHQPPDPDEQDGDHKTMVNLLAIILSLVILCAGFWLVRGLAEDKRTQDCLTAGFRNCSQKQRL
jgi:hypothetical protein